MLKSKGTINAMSAQMPLIYKTSSPEYWANADVVACEEARQKLRGLIKYLSEIENYRDILPT